MFRRSKLDESTSEPDVVAPRELATAGGGDDIQYEYRRTRFQILVLVLGVFTVIVCLLSVAFISVEAVKVAGIETKDVDLAAAGDDEPQNWLIVGSDSRDVIAENDPDAAVFTGGADTTGGQRSDTIMVVRIDPKGEHLDILSLQRDLWLPIARTGGSERINSAYGYPDGPQRLIDTIRQDFQIDINHYVEINFASFEGIVNAIGGVKMYFDKPMRDHNSGLMVAKAGCSTLDGYQALAFARARHLQYSDGTKWIDDPSGDLGRISRQQFFLRRMFDQTAAKGFTNPKTVHDLIEVARQYIKLDKDIEITKVAAMGERFGQFEGDSIRSSTLPVSPDMTDGGASILKIDAVGAQPILNRFRGLPDGDVAPETVGFSIENGSGVTGQGGEVQKAFQAIGYKPTGVKDHAPIARTQIHYGPEAAKTADQLARHLTAGADLVEDPTVGSARIVLITGQDFSTVMKRPRDPSTTNGATPGTTEPAPASSTTVKGQKPAATTTTTAAPGGLNNTDRSVIGIVPGQAPPGETCE